MPVVPIGTAGAFLSHAFLSQFFAFSSRDGGGVSPQSLLRQALRAADRGSLSKILKNFLQEKNSQIFAPKMPIGTTGNILYNIQTL